MPTPGILTFRDYIVVVAEELGIASYGDDNTGVAQIPEDADHLAICKKIANAGMARLYSARAKWQFLTQEVTINMFSAAPGTGMVDDENWRYYMPVAFTGQVFGTWEYGDDGPVGLDIQDCQARDIRRLRTAGGGQSTGYPRFAALVPPAPSGSASPHSGAVGGTHHRWQVWLYPAPSLNISISRFCRLRPWALADLDDVPMAAAELQDTLRAAVLAEAEQSRKTAGQHTALFEQMLARAMELDDQAGPKHLGYNGDPGAGREPDRAAMRTKGGVVSYNGIPTY